MFARVGGIAAPQIVRLVNKFEYSQYESLSIKILREKQMAFNAFKKSVITRKRHNDAK